MPGEIFSKTGQQTGSLGSSLGMSCAIDQPGKAAGNPKWWPYNNKLNILMPSLCVRDNSG